MNLEIDLETLYTITNDYSIVIKYKLLGGELILPDSWNNVLGELTIMSFENNTNIKKVIYNHIIKPSFRLSRSEYDRIFDTEDKWGYKPKPLISNSGERYWIWNFIDKEILLFNKNELICSAYIENLQGNYTAVPYYSSVGDSHLNLRLQSYGWDDYHDDLTVVLFHDVEKNTITYSIENTSHA